MIGHLSKLTTASSSRRQWYQFKLIIVSLLIIILRATVWSDPGSGRISGVIYDADSREPIPGVTVIMLNGFAGTSSGPDGRFTLKNLSYGTYSLQVSSIGYETLRLDSVIVAGNPSKELSINLTPKAVQLKSVTVTPGRFSIMGEEAVAKQTLTQRQIRTMPQLADDFFRAVSRLPGTSSNDFSTRFTVRGGEYEEVLVMLDGLQIYEPFHLKDIDGGAISVIDVAAVESIDLMTGGFPARYGDKMSGAFEIKSRQVPPNQNRFSAGISLINTHAFAEGKFDNNRGSWLFSARRGYIDYVLKLAGADDNIKPTYYDLFGKVQYQLSKRHSLSADILHAHDNMKVIGEENDTGDTLITEYGNSYAWMTLWSEFHPRLFAQTVASVGKVDHNRYGRDVGVFGEFLTDAMASDEEDFQFAGLKTDWEYEHSDLLVLKFGSEIQSRKATYDYINRDYNYDYISTPDSSYIEFTGIDSIFIPMEKSGVRFGSYLAGRFRVADPLVAEIGLRYDRTSYSGDDDFSPRLNLAYNIAERTAFCAGWGYYYQSEGVHEIMVGDGEDDFYPSQRAELLVAGIEHEFDSGIRLRAETYNKLYTNLRPAYRNSFDDIEAFPEMESDRTVIFRKNGSSRGIEFYLKKDTGGKFSWWSSYAYSKSEEDVDHIYFPTEDVSAYYDVTIPTPQDQRHTFYLDVHYRPTARWQLSTAFQYHSGWPYTNLFLASQSTPEGTVYWVQADEQWGARFKPYHRLDLRINRYFPLKKGRITAFIEILNVYNQKNVRKYNYYLRRIGDRINFSKEPDYWFGWMPSFGISYDINF
ncbi:MAG: TonB-dependent receptor [Candidatus Zixiibacteriota bacterium]|nr:MAG: TonB-dependent receptor [candidate division Zixibacteria bacterium]